MMSAKAQYDQVETDSPKKETINYEDTTVPLGALEIELNRKKYMVLSRDLEGVYTWEEAKEVCGKLTLLGFSDWSLPDQAELNDLYINKNSIGKFENTWYWSSTTAGERYACNQYFLDGFQGNILQAYTHLVRCIRKAED